MPPEEEVDPFIEQLKNVITQAGGTVDKIEKWGKRRLAYRVRKVQRRQLRAAPVHGQSETVKELERRCAWPTWC